MFEIYVLTNFMEGVPLGPGRLFGTVNKAMAALDKNTHTEINWDRAVDGRWRGAYKGEVAGKYFTIVRTLVE